MKLQEAARTIRLANSQAAENSCLSLMLSPDVMRTQMYYLYPGRGLPSSPFVSAHWIVVAHVREYRELN